MTLMASLGAGVCGAIWGGVFDKCKLQITDTGGKAVEAVQRGERSQHQQHTIPGSALSLGQAPVGRRCLCGMRTF